MKIKTFFTFALCASIALTGCKKEKPVNTEDTIALEIKNSSESLDNYTKTWHITNKRILLVLGYGANEDEQVEQITSSLSKTFGLAQDSGEIITMVYPKDFHHSGRSYVSDLKAVLDNNETDYAGIIIVGAPENTHLALSDNMSKWDEELPYPVFSLFPQDDILGTQASSDIVIDNNISATSTNQEETESGNDFSVDEIISILENAINYMNALDGAVKGDQLAHVTNMFPDKKIRRYVDPDSGLHAINHFILE